MRPAKQFQNTEDGFTLVEVAVSMSLLAIVFASSFASYILGLHMINDAREEVRASQIIQSEVERLRTKNWAQLSAYPQDVTEFTPHGEYIKEYSTEYTATRYILPLNNDKQKLIRVTVRWENSGGRKSVRTFRTIFTQNGLNDYYYRDI